MAGVTDETDVTGNGTPFGRALRRMRADRGMSLAQLEARLKATTPYSRSHISRIENGEKRPTEKFARACDHVLNAGGALLALLGLPAPDECPYPGLTSFATRDARWFFGRDRAVAELVCVLGDARTAGHPLVLMGPSGVGKSSLLKAGLAPAVLDGALPRQHPGTVEVRCLTPTSRPVEELAAVPRNLAQGAPALVVVDQFEELFTLCTDGDERERFIDELCRRAAAGQSVALGIRADFYGHCLAHPQLVAALRARTVPLGPMTEAELREAINRPAAAAGLSLEPGLVEVLLRDLGAHSAAGGNRTCEPGALPLLSHALRATWQHRTGGVLTVAGYERTGGIGGAVAATAESVHSGLGSPQQEVARQVMLRLVRVGDGEDDTRRRVEKTELMAVAPEALAVVEAFTGARLLTATASHVEISHEALLRAWPRLRRWIHEDRTSLRAHQQLVSAARAWEEEGKDPHLLYQGTRLLAAQDLAETGCRLQEPELAFLRASVEQQEATSRAERRRVHRLRLLTATLTVLALLLGGVAFVAGQQSSRAQQETDRAWSGQLAELAADARAQGRPEVAALLAYQAHHLYPDARSRGALFSAQNDFLAGRLEPPAGAPRPVGQALSGNGQVLATHDTAGGVRLWDVAHRRSLRTWETGSGPLRTVALDAAGHTVAAARGTEVYLRQGARTATVAMEGPVESLALSPDGRTLAVADRAAGITLIDTGDLRRSPLHGGHTGVVMAVAFSPDGACLVSGGEDRTARLWSVADHRLVHTYEGHSEPVAAATVSGDGALLATVSSDNTARLWRMTGDHAAVATLTGATNNLSSVAFSRDGTLLAASGKDLRVRLWSVPNRTTAITLPGHTAPVRGIGFAADGRTLVSTAEDGSTALWDLAQGFLPGAQGSQAHSVTFLRNGAFLVSSADSTPRLWNVTTRHREGIFAGHGAHVYRTAASADGTTLATSGNDATVRLWDTTTRRQRDAYATQREVCGLALGPTARILAAGEAGGTVYVWHPPRDKPLTYRPADAAPCAMAISKDEKTLAFGSDDGWIHLLDLTDPAAHPVRLGHHSDSVRGLAFTPDGRTLASASNDNQLKIWNVRSHRQEERTITDFSDVVHGLSYNRDGTLLAASGGDGTIRLWKTPAYQPYAVITGHEQLIDTVTFAPTGTRLASASDDGTVRLWDLDENRVARSLCTRNLRRGLKDWKRYAPGVQPPAGCG
ncbi:nSTAND1 domain-containing NTPase [Streptomyces sp. URMC 127]|uniref:nSTAND1 domain-containing NTPase n=1 Tax=Streptomyces sp. URMC 127 TaxID=3423402 RepID=UPI003F1BF505